MPTRMIRGELLDSQRYWSVSTDARQLYFHILLTADDFGLLSLAPVFIRRRCFNEAPSDQRINAMLGELADADLIRIYEVKGARFGFVPRFRQRLQRMTLKHPQPVDNLYQDDDDAMQKFNKINGKIQNQTVGQPQSTVGQPPEVKGSRREVKGREEEVKAPQPVDNLPWWRSNAEIEKAAKGLGMEGRPGETHIDLKARVFAELARRKQAA